MEIPEQHNVETVIQRMVSCLLDDNIDGFRYVLDEMDDCTQCLRMAVYHLARHYAGCLVMSAGGREEAADAAAELLGRSLM